MKSGKLKRWSRSTLFLFLISPFVLSIAIHVAFLIYASFTSWQFSGSAGQNTESILLDIKPDDSAPAAVAESSNLQPALPEQIHKRISPKNEAIYQPAIPKIDSKPGGAGGTRSELDILRSMEGTESHGDWLRVDPSWGSGKGSGGGLDSGALSLPLGPKGPVQSFGEYIRALRQSGLDVVIVVDSTASMGPVIREVKFKIENLALALKKLVPSCRIGVVSYRDWGEAYVTRKLPLSYGVSSVKEFLRRIEAEDGGDAPEAVDEGLRVAIEEMPWNPKAKAFILIIGDEPPHDKDIPRTIEMATAFRKRTGGIISVLDVKTRQERIRSDFGQDSTRFVNAAELRSGSESLDRQEVDDTLRSISEAGGGEAGRIIGEEKVVKQMLLHIFGTQWRAYLTEIMKNL